MKKIHYLLLLLPFILGSCDRNQYVCKEQDLVEAPPEFLQYWYFPKGSYWIYKLQDTVGVYDTVRVTNDHKRYCKGDDPHNPDCDQGNCVWMYSNTWEHSDTTFFYSKPNYPANHYTTSYYFGTYWAVAGSGSAASTPPYLFKYPYTINETFLGNTKVVSEDTINVIAGTFAKTVHIIPEPVKDNDSSKYDYVKHLYITPQVGVIKWHYTHNKIWELVEYDVTP